MVELQKRYKIGVRQFGRINYVGLVALWYRECSRFFIVWAQTLLSPLVSSLLFLSVLTLALGNDRGDVLGYSFVTFLAPGLIIQSMILQSFSHSVSSFMISKMQGNLVDILYAPLSSFEVSFAIIMAAVTRSILIGFISIVVFIFIVELPIKNIFYILYAAFFGSFFIGSLGFITGLWATKFDHTATVTNFILQPLSFLSGVFYTIDRLPEPFFTISLFNPFYYIIDGFRSAFQSYNNHDLVYGITYISVLNLLLYLLSYFILKKGWMLKP